MVNKRKKRRRMKRSKTISFLFACPKYILFVVNYFLLEKVKTREVFFSLVKTKMELQFDCVVKRSKTIFFPCACPKYILFVVNYFLLEKAKTFSFSFPYQFFSSPHFFFLPHTKNFYYLDWHKGSEIFTSKEW